MPKERLHINRFDGVIGVADAHDLPPGAASYAENLDIVTRDGSFVGLPEDEAYSGSHAGDAIVALFEDSDTAVTYDSTSGDIKAVSFSHTGKTATASNTSSQATGKSPAMASGGQAVHVGMGNTSTDTPKWVGTPYHDQFNDGAAGTRIVADAEITSDAIGWCRTNLNDDVTQDIYLGCPTARNATTDANMTSFGSEARFDNSTVIFKTGGTYVWYASAVYDGSQEAPPKAILRMDIRPGGVWVYNENDVGRQVQGISEDANYSDWINIGEGAYAEFANDTKWRVATANGSSSGRAQAPITGLEEIKFYLKVRTATGGSDPVISRRVSGVKIYRSERFQSEDGNFIESEPQFVRHYFLDDVSGEYSWATATSADGASEPFDENGTYRHILVQDDKPASYTFESSSGYPATVEHMKFHWGLSCVSNEYHIIGDCWHEDLQDVDTYLFRSEPFAYNTFNPNNYLVLPNRPRAMVAYDGRVYAFAKGKVFVINPVTWDIVTTWEGLGVESPKSVTVSEAGLFWASRTGIYHFVANQVKPIGTAVLRMTRPRAINDNVAGKPQEVGWLARDTDVIPVCEYSPIQDSLMVFYSVANTAGGTSEYPALMYHVPTGRWSPISDLGAQVVNTHITSNGDLLYGNDSGVFTRMFTSANRRRWRFVSRQLGEQGEVHKYYNAYIGTSIVDSAPIVRYYTNDPAYRDPINAYKPTDNRQHDRLYKYQFTASYFGAAGEIWSESRDFAIEVSDTLGNLDCTDITLIRRRISPR